jgi:spore maturation protein SpmA
MLSPLWWLPLAVAAAAVVPVWRGARRLAGEAAGLQASIAELQGVRPLVAQVKAEIAATHVAAGRAVADLGAGRMQTR